MPRPMKTERLDQHYTLGRCRSGKRGFISRAAAKSAARRALSDGQGRMRPYECDCGYWHIGHLPASVKAGNGWWGE